MKWIHIQDEQPSAGSLIMKVQKGYESLGHYYHYIGETIWNKYDCPWQSSIDFRIENDLEPENWWWMYSSDFPFPIERKD